MEKVYFKSQILEHPSIGECWNIFGTPVLHKNVIFMFFTGASDIQILTIILESKNDLILSNTCAASIWELFDHNLEMFYT